ncbi:hypothetical protein [Streptomyces camelliae]|uniref:Lipoprotein n=1 Tax=Streptomyces camelliae TaxID=3004093 RepID=A0ABY7PBI7_9ACTN|nr:hypothetical protein [Streptomyces sp. HUAS 2-6]WBO66972.1 hypothetical protein O1G22_31270 [Streptomyces sp. HUAS 2-6]
MGRRGEPRPGVRFLVLGLALPALLLTPSCARPADTGHPSPNPTSASTSASAADLCTRLVSHWSREVLDGTTYGDYQSMGLSTGQFEILRTVVDAARVVQRRQGTSAADELIGRQARQACAERYRHGTPSGGSWQ